MQVDSLPLSSDDWLKLISKQPDVYIFHHPSWIEFLAECYGFTPYLLVLRTEDGRLRGGLPIIEINSWLTGHRVISLPFSDFCPPLFVDETAGIELVNALAAWRKQNNWAQLQVRWPLVAQAGLYPGESFYQHFTKLARDADHVFRTFNKSQTQRHIHQAEKLGVTIRQGKSWEDVSLFYDLHIQTRRRQGVPVQPMRFFRILWERLISQGLGFVLLAYHERQLLAGAIFLHYNKTITYKFGASYAGYWKFRPNDLIFWYAIRWACENGYQVFDWGRTDLENDGLRNFKRGWGSEERLLHYTIFADKPPSYKSLDGAQKHLMETIIQHSPLWVCRLAGELFYVHSA